MMGRVEKVSRDFHQHGRDSKGQRMGRPAPIGKVQSPDKGCLTFSQVTRTDLEPDRHALELPFIELEAWPLLAPVDLHPDVLQLFLDADQGAFDLPALGIAAEDRHDDDLYRRDPAR